MKLPRRLAVRQNEFALSTLNHHDANDAGVHRRGTRRYFAASSIAQLCTLVRYVVLARLLGPEQLGLAAIVILTAQFFEAVSDTGGDRFLIQDKDGDDPVVQKNMHLVFVGRGILVAIALVASAPLIAALYGASELIFGLGALALSPLISGFMHLDMRRAQRHSDFRAESAALITSEVLGLLVTLLASYVTRDFTAILYGLIVRSLGVVVVSHLLAVSPYYLGYSHEHMTRLFHFAVPLMLNGFLLFLGSQGDRVLVADWLGVADLGLYTAVLLLVYYPSGMVTRYLAAVHLPLIAAGRDNLSQRKHASDTLGTQTVLVSLLMTGGFVLVGPTVVATLYGPQFQQSAFVIGLIGILQASRFMRLWPNTVALAMGRTNIVLAGNMLRLIALPGAVIGVALWGGLPGIVLGFIIGESFALVFSTILTSRASGNSARRDIGRIGLFFLVAASIQYGLVVLQEPTVIGGALLLCGILGLLSWVFLWERSSIQEALHFGRRLLRRG